QSRGEALELVDDHVLGVPVVSMRDMRIGPDRMYVAGGPSWVGEVLLSDENERGRRHSAHVDLALGLDDFLEGTTDVHGPGTATRLVRPRHAAVDGEVQLVGGRPVLVAAIGTCDAAGK